MEVSVRPCSGNQFEVTVDVKNGLVIEQVTRLAVLNIVMDLLDAVAVTRHEVDSMCVLIGMRKSATLSPPQDPVSTQPAQPASSQ